MIPSFRIGGDTGVESPEAIRRQRAVALALLGQASDTSPTDMYGGIARVGQGVISALMNRRADKQEARGRDDANAKFNSIIGSLMGPQAAPSPVGAETVNPSIYEMNGIPDPRSPEFTVQDDRNLSIVGGPGMIHAPPQGQPPSPQFQPPPEPQPQGNTFEAAAQEVDALPMADIMELMNNPYLTEAQSNILGMVVKSKFDRGEWRSMGDGRIFNSGTGEVQDLGKKIDPLDAEYKRAQIEALKARGQDARARLGLNPQYGIDENGNPVLLQIGDDGSAVQTQMPEGVRLSKEPIKLDAGTHYVLLDPITRQPVGQIPKDVAGEAAAQAAGKVQGDASATAPAAKITAEQTVGYIDELLNNPNLAGVSGIESYLPDAGVAMVSGGGALGIRRRIEQLKGTAFLEAYNGLRGGGQITEIEGQKAENAMARLETAQTDEDYRQALKDFRDAVVVGYQKLAARAGGNAPVLNVPNGQPRRRYNPATGALE